jgi:polysaccharide export outer membrane protein
MKMHANLDPRSHRAGALLSIALFAALCWPVGAGAQAPAHYVVGPDDVLAISVFGQAELTGKFNVETDGTFSYPLIGRVEAGGRSLRVIEVEVRDRLADGQFVRDPQVTVSVAEYRSQQVFVLGEVRQPGTLEFTGTMMLLEALAGVGSTTERASSEALIIRRSAGAASPAPVDLARAQESPGSEVTRIDLEKLQTGALELNVPLQSGDTIFVPRLPTVFVSGNVRSPGEYALRKPLTVRQVITLAGGVTDRGSTRRIQIVRLVDGDEATVNASLEDVVQAGDTILVRERFF